MRRNLKALRSKYGLNQVDIANEIQVSEQSYRSKENGSKDFWLGEARAISQYFSRLEQRKISIEEIFFDR